MIEPISEFIDRKYRLKFHKAFTAYRVEKILKDDFQQKVRAVVLRDKIIIYCQSKSAAYLLNIKSEKLRQLINNQLKLELKKVIVKS